MDNQHTFIGTVGGTALALVSIDPSTVITAVIVGFVGAVGSFLGSMLAKKIWLFLKSKFKNAE